MARPTRRFTLIELLILVAFAGITVSMLQPRACRSSRQAAAPPPQPAPAPAPDAEDQSRTAAIEKRLRPPSRDWNDGLAAIVLVDVSGSMNDRVRDADGERRRKIAIAQRAASDLVQAFATYAHAHPSETVSVGIYEFSARDGQPAARVVVPAGPPDAESAAPRLAGMKARGGTPIGDAMIEARRALDATGLRRRHLLVITDGENTSGVPPADVARVMERQDEAARAALYFVAFDVGAASFEGVKRHGGMLLSARDGGELRTTLDELLSDKILVEAPRK